ncbi:MAG: hypothetical protein DRP42_06810, partial [Tenericutes bacterium]
MAIRPIQNTATGQVENNPLDENTGGMKITTIQSNEPTAVPDIPSFGEGAQSAFDYAPPTEEGVEPQPQETNDPWGDRYQDYSNV